VLLIMNDWYSELQKAPWTPPDYVFGPIWTVLYILMAASYFLIRKTKQCIKYCDALNYFFLQLFFNLMWSFIFFDMKMPLYALIDMILIIAFTCMTYVAFSKFSKTAARLLIPYILWLGVAFSLNLYIVLNN